MAEISTAIGPWLLEQARLWPWTPVGRLAKTVLVLVGPGKPFPRTSREILGVLPEGLHGTFREAQREHRDWLALVTQEEPPENNPFALGIWYDHHPEARRGEKAGE